MEPEKLTGDGGGAAITTTKVPPSFVAAVASSNTTRVRQRFTVELRPDETTIVSWKKLLKEANVVGPVAKVAVEVPTGAYPALEARIAPAMGGQTAESKPKDAPLSCFSSVIEKIERLYVGNRSSDDEGPADVPDDQYDTEDSFIDDADLDEYFEVDKSTTKHNGFFINRGTLEQLNEPIISPNHQPKKRRRKDTVHSEKGCVTVTAKHEKVGAERMKTAARTANKSSGSSLNLATQSEQYQDGKSKNQLTAPMVLPRKKKSSEPIATHEQSLSSNVDPVEMKYNEYTEKQKNGNVQSRDSGMKVDVANESSHVTHHMDRAKGVSAEYEPQSRKKMSDKEIEPSTKFRHKEKNGGSESSHAVFPKTKYIAQSPRISSTMHGKDSARKGTMLERALRELESVVAEEPRPKTVELKEGDSSSQGVKRRLPREVKHKLDKVAKIAASQGKISEDLIGRLMGILGDIVNLRTLKRNLKEMTEDGLPAKKENDNMIQQMKNEVLEMVKARLLSLKAKAADQRDGASDDFKEVYGSAENGDVKGKYCMDKAMEDKLCDIYDHYTEGMDEGKGPVVRKLYVELAELWPSGTMDNRGIKDAVCRSKARRRALDYRHKAPDKPKQTKSSSANVKIEDNIVRGEASLAVQPHVPVQEKVHSADSGSRSLTSPHRVASDGTSHSYRPPAQGRMSLSHSHSSANGSSDKSKGGRSSTNFVDEATRKSVEHTMLPKKLKRKSETDLDDTNNKDSNKSQKQAGTYPQKAANPQLPSGQGCEQFS